MILALDQGTTSSRAIVFDGDGRIQAVAQREYAQHYPQPGWVEHDPIEIWVTQLAVAHEAIARAGAEARDIKAIGITNQRETTVVWERSSGKPIHPAIVWQDRRTAAACDALKTHGLEAAITAKTGLLADAYFSGTKIAWILDHVPGARTRAEAGELAFGTIDSWLIWNLTGGAVHATDSTNASRTLLFNITTGAWDEELLKWLRVPAQILPEVCASSGVIAETAAGLFGARIPIAGIAGDQQAALFGQRCTQAGMAKNTYGTGCFMLMCTGDSVAHTQSQLLSTAACSIGAQRQYALEGSVFIGGAVVQWLRDGLGIIRATGEVEALANSAPDNGGVYLVPAFTGLGSPHWDPRARGTIMGLTRGSSAAHIARAALESIAFQTADVLSAMVRDSGIGLRELRVDGGAARNNALMQFQADVLGLRVVRPRIQETTALGAAYLAGLGTGYWKTSRQLDAQWQIERSFEPQMERDQAARMLAGWHRAVERSKDWVE
ncbi:MAG: glycerol kinase GlpK [Burkholderiales bacterium]|jgi:glycerol kinase|nr:glycerol kinase GlpK [Burkholderiales bacterium]